MFSLNFRDRARARKFEEKLEGKTEEKPKETENDAEDEPEGISKELAAQLSLQDDELEENREGNDSETVEVGSNDEEDKMTSHEAKRRSLSPTEELSATKISEISEICSEAGTVNIVHVGVLVSRSPQNCQIPAKSICCLSDLLT